MIVDASWPSFDESKIKTNTVEIAVQINGVVRFKVSHEAEISADDLKAQVLADDRLKPYVDGKEIKKTIIIPGRIANIVV